MHDESRECTRLTHEGTELNSAPFIEAYYSSNIPTPHQKGQSF